MKLYLDDDLASPFLARILRQAGYDVFLPVDAGLAGESDPVHFTFAIRHGRICLSRNYQDYEDLHDLILVAQGHHPGIFVVRRDNNPKRNMKHQDIVRALKKLESSGLPLGDHYHILNQWQ